MSNWEQREQYLIEVAERCLRGHKAFDLRRSHLVSASQISKGTIYNHFPCEADLMVAVACNDFRKCMARARQDESQYPQPLSRFLFHHCWCLRDNLLHNRFVISRVMPNVSLLELASAEKRRAFEDIYGQYIDWNRKLIKQVGEVAGFNRAELVANYLRGTVINCDDADKDHDDASMYYQFSYGITHLLGHSDKRLPTQSDFCHWLSNLEEIASAA